MIDGGIPQIYNYEGRLQATLRTNQMQNSSTTASAGDSWTGR